MNWFLTVEQFKQGMAAQTVQLSALITSTGKTIMAAIDDLNAVVAGLSTSLTDLSAAVSAENADIDKALALITTPGATEAQIASAVQQIATAKANIDAAVVAANAEAAKAQAVLPPAPTP